MFVDTHAHVHFPEFQHDQEDVLKRARDAEVRCLINVGTDLESSRASIGLAERHDFIYATVGIHPHDAKDATDEDLAALRELARHRQVVAIGEVGLDFFRNLSPREVQRTLLLKFFDLAKETGLPLVLHIRDAYDQMLELLQLHFAPPVKAVCHCFSGSREIMERFLEMGLFISFAGPVSYKKNEYLREAARACPEDRILIETDAPFLSPGRHRGKRNEPAYVVETARLIAELKAMGLERFGELTSRNAERLFGRSFAQ